MDTQEAQDQTTTVLEPGQPVETPLGPGTIQSISIAIAEYNGEIQMEPPDIKVKLDSGKVVHVCMCKIKVGDPEIESIVQQEFARLWPPVQGEVPEAADMLVPEPQEFHGTVEYKSARYRRIT